MKVFISQPMRGLDEEEILKTRDQILEGVAGFLGIENETIREVPSFNPSMKGMNAVRALGSSIELLGQADYVFFAPGWDEAPGCRVEHYICELYDIPFTEIRRDFDLPMRYKTMLMVDDEYDPKEARHVEDAKGDAEASPGETD